MVASLQKDSKVEFAEAVDAGRVHMVSSIAAAGLYKGTWREDMFDDQGRAEAVSGCPRAPLLSGELREKSACSKRSSSSTTHRHK